MDKFPLLLSRTFVQRFKLYIQIFELRPLEFLKKLSPSPSYRFPCSQLAAPSDTLYCLVRVVCAENSARIYPPNDGYPHPTPPTSPPGPPPARTAHSRCTSTTVDRWRVAGGAPLVKSSSYSPHKYKIAPLSHPGEERRAKTRYLRGDIRFFRFVVE